MHMVKRIAGIFFARSIPAAGVIVLTLIAPMVLDIERAAIFLTGVTLLYLLGIISRFGFDIHVLKICSARFKDESKLVDSTEVVFFLLSLSLSIVLLVAYLFLSAYFVPIDAYGWVFYALPAFSCQGILASFLKATGDEFWGAMAEPSISSLLAVAIFFIFRTSGSVDLALAFSYAIWGVLFFTLCYVCSTRSFLSCADTDIKSGLVDSWHFFLNQISSYASQWYPLFLLGAMDKRLVIYYAVANRMATVISFVGVTIDSFSAPRFSNFWKTGNISELYAVRSKIANLSRIGAIACFFFVGAISYVYGEWQSFDVAYGFMSFTLITCYAASISFGPNGFFLMMTNGDRYATRISFFVLLAIVTITSLFFLINAPLMMSVSVGLAVLIRSFLFYLKVVRVDDK